MFQLFDSWLVSLCALFCLSALCVQISLTDGELEVGAGHVWGISRFLRATVPIVQGDKCDCLFVGFAGLSQPVAFRYLPPRELCGREVFPPVAGPPATKLLETVAEAHSLHTHAQTQTRTQRGRSNSGTKAGGDDGDADADEESEEIAPLTEPPTRARVQPPRANEGAAQDL